MQHIVSALKNSKSCLNNHFTLISKSKLKQIGLTSCERLVGVDVALALPKRRDLS